MTDSAARPMVKLTSLTPACMSLGPADLCVHIFQVFLFIDTYFYWIIAAS